MNQYTGSITFLYYEDFQYGKQFMKEVLELEEVMDQGWAMVFSVRNKAFIGIVSKQNEVIAGDTLVSLNTLDVEKAYSKIKSRHTINLTEIKHFESIPLKSFFFEDKEGHRFEIQEFLKEEDKLRF